MTRLLLEPMFQALVDQESLAELDDEGTETTRVFTTWRAETLGGHRLVLHAGPVPRYTVIVEDEVVLETDDAALAVALHLEEALRQERDREACARPVRLPLLLLALRTRVRQA